MPRYYCDYCDTYLTHDSPSVRKQHNAGYKHKANVRSYYQQFEEQQTQSLIDQRIKEHLGQAAAFQVGAQFNQHLLSLPGGIPRPRLPMMPMPMIPGMRPPVLPTPTSGVLAGYPGGIPTMPPGAMPMGGTSMPMQMTSLPRPPMLPPPVSGSGGATIPAMNPVMYQPAPPPGSAAPPAPQVGAPPSASFGVPMQMTSLPWPRMLPPPVSGSGGAPIPAMNPVMYQPAVPPGYAAPPAPQGGAPPNAWATKSS